MDEGAGVCQVEDSLPSLLKGGRETVTDDGFQSEGPCHDIKMPKIH